VGFAVVSFTIHNTRKNKMSYDDAIESVVTRREAIAEIKAHGLDPQDFFDEVGRKEEYIGLDVLSWLGY
jgi:hypothetical protein